jgi:uncharacterized protein with GYD domain
MTMYLFQGKYTPESFRKLVAHPQDRTALIAKMAQSAGGKLHHLYYAFGEYDVVAIMEYPDNVSMAAVAMTVAAGGGLSGGMTTILMTTAEAQAAMKQAGSLEGSYKAPN